MDLNKTGKKIILENDNLRITKKVGKCLICDNNVYIYYDKTVNKPIGKCSNYSEHLYSFDPTVSKGIPVEIQKYYISQQ